MNRQHLLHLKTNLIEEQKKSKAIYINKMQMILMLSCCYQVYLIALTETFEIFNKLVTLIFITMRNLFENITNAREKDITL